tara:strand:- start:937 stop:1308 length:372 start_codon:yes stop_codon:yes gene_type:complete
MDTPYRQGKFGLQVLRDKIGEFEIWETIPTIRWDGQVMRKIGEQVSINGEMFTVVDVKESCAMCEATTLKLVKFITDGGKEVKYKAKSKNLIRISTYREPKQKEKRTRTARSSRTMRGSKQPC